MRVGGIGASLINKNLRQDKKCASFGNKVQDTSNQEINSNPPSNFLTDLADAVILEMALISVFALIIGAGTKQQDRGSQLQDNSVVISDLSKELNRSEIQKFEVIKPDQDSFEGERLRLTTKDGKKITYDLNTHSKQIVTPDGESYTKNLTSTSLER